MKPKGKFDHDLFKNRGDLSEKAHTLYAEIGQLIVDYDAGNSKSNDDICTILINHLAIRISHMGNDLTEVKNLSTAVGQDCYNAVKVNWERVSKLKEFMKGMENFPRNESH